MGKYSGLKGQIPEFQTPHDEAVTKAIAERKGHDRLRLTAELNRVREEQDRLTALAKAQGVLKTALEYLIRADINASGEDKVTVNGYTWSPIGTPFPVIADPEVVVQYLKDNGMEDLLTLTTAEVSSRVANFVKEEAQNGQLKAVTVTKQDPETGKDYEEVEVYSTITGVRVWMKPTLYRCKVSQKLKGAVTQ